LDSRSLKPQDIGDLQGARIPLDAKLERVLKQIEANQCFVTSSVILIVFVSISDVSLGTALPS
jgi:hypothetical protein